MAGDPTTRNLCLFVLGVTAAFVYICNAIPQIKAEAVTEASAIGEAPAELVQAGAAIFASDRAQCLTCHSLGEDPKARCPNQAPDHPEGGVGARAARRRPGLDAAQYLVESLYDPNAYIVPGYPRGQMQPVQRAPIGLGHDEILAVIAYLNSLGGVTDETFLATARRAQEPWRNGLKQPGAGQVARYRPPILPGEARRGREVFDALGCIKCHRIGAEGKDRCPDLSAIGAAQSPDYILESIVEPAAVIVKGYAEYTIEWKGDDRPSLNGRVRAWTPDAEWPTRLTMIVTDDIGEPVDQEVALDEVAQLGDARVFLKDEDADPVVGIYLEGDARRGVKLRVWTDAGWQTRLIAGDQIDELSPPASSMPADFAAHLTADKLYDLLAFLGGLKGAGR